MVSLKAFIDRMHSGPGFDSESNRNEYQEYFLEDKDGWCIRLIILQPSCADCLEVWEHQTPGTVWEHQTPGTIREHQTPGTIREHQTPGTIRAYPGL